MVWGLVQVFAISPAGPGLPAASVGGHAHFGILSILAVVTGFAIERTELTGTLRSTAVWGFVAGQWLLPATIWLGEGAGYTVLLPTMLLWGVDLIVSMLVMAWAAWTRSARGDAVGPGAVHAD